MRVVIGIRHSGTYVCNWKTCSWWENGTEDIIQIMLISKFSRMRARESAAYYLGNVIVGNFTLSEDANANYELSAILRPIFYIWFNCPPVTCPCVIIIYFGRPFPSMWTVWLRALQHWFKKNAQGIIEKLLLFSSAKLNLDSCELAASNHLSRHSICSTQWPPSIMYTAHIFHWAPTAVNQYGKRIIGWKTLWE